MNALRPLLHRLLTEMLPRTWDHRLAEIVLVATAYYVAGRLGLLLAIPPGYATAIWPPAGIALAFALVRGPRVVPGVWLGSFALNLWISLQIHPNAAFWPSVAVAGSIGLGATLQTLAGVWLVRRTLTLPDPLIDVRDIVRFLAFGGPAASLIGASWGVVTLHLAGAISTAQMPFSWATWWVGDTLGVLVLAPLTVIGFASGTLKRKRLLQVGLPMALALVMSVALFVVLSESQRTWELWLAMVGMLLLTQLLGAFLLTVTGQRARIEQLVFQRTAELARSNLELEAARLAALAANQAKSEFLANMSHEIRTPMTAILGYAELLREECRDSEFAIEAIDTVQRNGYHLLELINDILDLSKIESGKLEIERIACSPKQIVDGVLTLMKERAQAKGLSLQMQFDPTTPSEIRTDPTRLRQILLNLVGNAIKFTERGSVAVATRWLGATDGRGRIQFSVSDTGIGMSSAQLGRLFQPFTQADMSTTRKFGGTGLGLTISRRLATLLDGELTVVSAAGQGSCFQVTVDAGATSDVTTQTSANDSTPSSVDDESLPSLACRVLLAEDCADNRRLISRELQNAGAVVTVVDDGRQACERLLAPTGSEFAADGVADGADDRPAFDVVLMDMQMPVLDGYEATRRLRTAGYSGPILALTVHAMNRDRQRCLDAGCTDYASKPIDRKTLLRLVARYAPQPNDVAARHES